MDAVPLSIINVALDEHKTRRDELKAQLKSELEIISTLEFLMAKARKPQREPSKAKFKSGSLGEKITKHLSIDGKPMQVDELLSLCELPVQPLHRGRVLALARKRPDILREVEKGVLQLAQSNN